MEAHGFYLFNNDVIVLGYLTWMLRRNLVSILLPVCHLIFRIDLGHVTIRK